MTPQDFATLLEMSLLGEGHSPISIQMNKLLLAQFQMDRVDPHADQEAVAAIQRWAMNVAKDNGANTPREALALIRGHEISDEEWQPHRDLWEMLWPELGASNVQRG